MFFLAKKNNTGNPYTNFVENPIFKDYQINKIQSFQDGDIIFVTQNKGTFLGFLQEDTLGLYKIAKISSLPDTGGVSISIYNADIIAYANSEYGLYLGNSTSVISSKSILFIGIITSSVFGALILTMVIYTIYPKIKKRKYF